MHLLSEVYRLYSNDIGSSPIGGTTGGSGSQSGGAGAGKFTFTCSSESLDSVTQSGGDLNK
jgi:hypothetical protein